MISHNSSVGDTSHTESFRLVEGDYEFTDSDIYDDLHVVRMWGRVIEYNKYDELILEGRGDLEWSVCEGYFFRSNTFLLSETSEYRYK